MEDKIKEFEVKVENTDKLVAEKEEEKKSIKKKSKSIVANNIYIVCNELAQQRRGNS